MDRWAPAVSISTELLPLLAGRMRLRVHSAFDRAANLTVETPTSASLPLNLITVAHAEVGNLPNGVLIAAGATPLRELVQGQSVSLDRERLRLGDGVIDLHEATPWDPSLDGRCARGRARGWRARWAAAWELVRRAVEGAPASPLWGIAGARVEQLASALAGRALDGALAAAERLIGLGPGLTPSGDDLIVGLLAGGWCRVGAGAPDAFLTAWADGVLALADRTTDVSRVYLGWAARGCVTQRLGDVLDAVLWPRRDGQFAEAVSAALRVGSTSGADGLLGLLLGVRLWSNESEGYHANTA